MPKDPNAKKWTRNDINAWAEKWAPVVEGIFANPDGQHACPVCGRQAIRAAWGLYIREPRTASFDAWCQNCGAKYHCATLLPAHAPDRFPPGSAHVVANLTKEIFERGKKQKWW